MKKFIARLNDDSYINICADEMQIKEDTFILVYNEKNLVAFLDVGVVLSAHMSEKGVQ